MVTDALKKAVKDLYSNADYLLKNKITYEGEASSVLDYKANLDSQRRRTYLSSLKRVQAYLGNVSDVTLAPLLHKISTADPSEVHHVRGLAEQLAEALPDMTHSSLLSVEAPAHIPHEIKDDLLADLTEIRKCFDAGCYRSAVILCGRVLEVCLHRKYYEATGTDALEKSPGIGLGNLIAKMRDKGVQMDPAVTQQIHLVNQVRVFSVHKKQQAFSPSKDQAQAIILYTTDLMNRMF